MPFSVNILRRVTVEPVLFAFMLATFLKVPVTQQLIFKKTCIQVYNDSFCQNVFTNRSCGHNSEVYDVVESQTSKWIFYLTLAYSIPSIASALLLGSFSDQFGRKVVILMPLIGSCFEAVSSFINVHYLEASPAYFFFGNIVSGMFGGFSTILMAVFSYMADITNEANRTWRIGLLESMIFIGGTIGVLISGILIDRLGFMVPFIVILTLHVVSIIYVILLLSESYYPRQQFNINSLFTFGNWKGGIQVCTKARPQHRRLRIALALCMGFFVPLLAFAGTNDVIVLFVLNRPFCFTATMIGYFLAVSFIVKSFGVFFGVPVMSRVLKFSDPTIASIGILTNMASNIFIAFAKNGWQVFLAVSIGIFNGVTVPGVRAMISKLVDCHEQGSLFAVLACVETISTVVGSLIFNNLYASTVSTLPGLSFFVMAGILVLPLCCMMLFYRHPSTTVNTMLQDNDDPTHSQDSLT